jgi:hypothetical protein
VKRALEDMDSIGYLTHGKVESYWKGRPRRREVKPATWWRGLADWPEHPRPEFIPWKAAEL